MNKTIPPDIALLDYLGRYQDAADGLDPLGLAESALAAEAPGDSGRGPGAHR